MPDTEQQNDRRSQSTTHTTVSIWRTTIPVLDAIRRINRRSRAEQLDYFCALEAQRLGIEQKAEQEPGDPT